MRSALFCDGAYWHAIGAIAVPTHVLVTIVEDEVVREVAVVAVVVRSRTPIAAIATSIAERRPVAETRSRKEDTTAVWSYNL